MLVGAGGVVDDCAACTGFGNDVAHFDLQRVTLQIRQTLSGIPRTRA